MKNIKKMLAKAQKPLYFFTKYAIINSLTAFRGYCMAISYKKLWKILIDRDMKKGDLARAADLSGYTLNKLNHGENVNAETLAKICVALNCNFDDIMEIVPDKN